MCPLIDSYDLSGIPLKPNLVSFSDLNPYPSNHCHNRLLPQMNNTGAFSSILSVFLHIVQAKKGAGSDMQMAASAREALTTEWHTKGFHL